MDELTSRFFGGWADPFARVPASPFTPVEVVTRGDDLVARAELPGIDPERDVEVGVDGGMLTIRGEHRRERTDDGDRYHRVERTYDSFQRTLPLPSGVDESSIKARYENGVLEVVVPNAAQVAAGRRIPVEVKTTQKARKAVGAKASKGKEASAR